MDRIQHVPIRQKAKGHKSGVQYAFYERQLSHLDAHPLHCSETSQYKTLHALAEHFHGVTMRYA